MADAGTIASAAGAIVASYALGTFPSAVMIAKSHGIDITKVGSGNPGASNIARTLGFKWGALAFLLDGAKGAAAAALGWAVHGRALGYICGALAIVGHMFPVTRHFRGGRGVATAGGILLVLQPIVALIAAAFWGIVVKLTKKASLGSIGVVPIVIGLFIALGTPGWELEAIIGIGILVEIKHLPNIKRLLSGSEPPVTR